MSQAVYLHADRSGSSESMLCETESFVSAVSRPSPVADKDVTCKFEEGCVFRMKSASIKNAEWGPKEPRGASKIT